MYFFRSRNFLGYKAGLSLLLVFFLPGPFFLALDGFFPASDGFLPLPPKCIFSAAKVLLYCCKVFFLLLWIFPAAKRHFWLAFFLAAETAFFPLQGVFFLLPNVFFSVPMFFPAANLCFSRAARRQGARERRVIHWAFATCKLDTAWTNR